MLFLPAHTAAGSLTVDQTNHTVTMRDGAGDLAIRLNTSRGCIVDSVVLDGKTVADAASSGIEVGGKWVSTTTLEHAPSVSARKDTLRVTGIEYGAGSVRVSESWTFKVKQDAIDWTVSRKYLSSGAIESTAMPSVIFKDMSTWTGAVLGSGGVAWCKLLDAPNATYAVKTSSATLWNKDSDACLRMSSVGAGAGEKAMRFTREPSGGFTVAAASTTSPLDPISHQTRFRRDSQALWAPFDVKSSEAVSATYELKPLSYQREFGRGNFKGLDTRAITEMVNTIGRIGVIDEARVGTNGWYSGYICMHEPWQARIGTTIDDPNYTRSEAEWLDYVRENAVKKDGMVMSRWYYNAGDAQPGTYDEKTGCYEAQWGRLMDSQSSYVWNVSDQFDQTGDLKWVARQKASCESALDYLLRRDTTGNGLVKMENSLIKQKRSSDWLDIVWAGYENAFVNAQLYGALNRWASVERILGDSKQAARYLVAAAKLKETFNKPIDQGGFWDPAKGWYDYWRDQDGSIHGNNLTVEVNLTALADGICDDPIRRKALLDLIESRMNAEKLMVWPACFDSFAPGEGADDKFPTYENGDIFLSWAEYGVKAYASTEPEVALKYVKNLVDQYNKDGLAFQRYLRADGKGAGDDILAGNCNVITGLYRDVYGIQPKYNRLLLDPHLTPALNGTSVNYSLRSLPIHIGLSVGDYRVSSDGVSVKSTDAFGVTFGSRSLSYFAFRDDEPSLTLGYTHGANLQVAFGQWKSDHQCTLSASKNCTVSLTFLDLEPGRSYRVVSYGKAIGQVSVKSRSINVKCQADQDNRVELVAS